MNELYLEDQGNAAGPYPIDQVRELVQAGSLTIDHLASTRPEGPWRPLREFGQVTAHAGPVDVPAPDSSGPDFHTFVSRFLDSLLKLCTSPFWRGELTARFYQVYQDFMCRLGQYALLACGVIMFFICGILAAKTNSGIPLIGGFGFAFVMVVGHYFAVKFSTANRKLLHCDTADLGSDAVPSSIAVLSLLLMIGFALSGLIGLLALMATDLIGAILTFLFAVQMAFSFFHTTILAKECKPLLHVNAEPADIPGGQVYLGIIKFFARLQLAWSFIFLGSGGVTAALSLVLAGLFLTVSSATPPPPNLYSLGSASGILDPAMMGYGNLGWGIMLALYTALMPLISHIIYLLFAFVVDLLNSVIRTAQNTERIP